MRMLTKKKRMYWVRPKMWLSWWIFRVKGFYYHRYFGMGLQITWNFIYRSDLVAAFRSPLMQALDRSVETLGLWIVTSPVTFIKSANQSSIKLCQISICFNKNCASCSCIFECTQQSPNLLKMDHLLFGREDFKNLEAKNISKKTETID